jgi:tRNA A-37 threonylcarbamoyl transferase component Bud32
VHIAHLASHLGTKLDRRYRLDRFVGEGVSAWVFAARDLRLDREVALKLFKPPRVPEQHDAQRTRFLAEGRTLAKLVHPHVVLVHDAGESEDGLRYLVMELSDSGSLEAELSRRGPLPAVEALQLLLPLAGALACAHDRGILHRDVKPANIALVRERGETQAKLLDFGIAKHRDAAGTTDGAIGTPQYMAPEQARAEALTPATDVWALGVVFFRCLSGKVPFEGRSSSETLLKLALERAPLFASACPELDPRLAIALDRALEPNPQRRYPDMRSFARGLAAACAQAHISLPRRLEPVGLPQLDLWMSDADVENTRPLPAVAAGSTAAPPARVAGARKLGWWVAAGLAAIVLGLLQMAVRRSEAARLPDAGRHAPARARAERVHYVSHPAASSPGRGVQTALRAERPQISTPTASQTASQKRTHPAGFATPPAARAVRTASSDSAAPASPLERKPAMIRTWEW